MNADTLARAQASFLAVYPRGFADPAMQAIRKKHNVDRLVSFAQAELTRVGCQRPDHVADTLLKVVSRSSMVSRFEKPPFRRFLEALDSDARRDLAMAVEARLFGAKQHGFEALHGMLAQHRIAKWAVLTAIPFYVAPRREVFVKPTTAKRIIAALEVADLHYDSTPSWQFYAGYRRLLAAVRQQVSPSLAPNYAALSGFLMMALPGLAHTGPGAATD